jgi:hypothetical protein
MNSSRDETQMSHTSMSAWSMVMAVVAAIGIQLSAYADAAIQQPTRVKIDGQELYAVGFDKLAAFEYTLVDAATGASEAEMEASRAKDQIPRWIRLYDKQKIALTGFMLPLVVENGLVRKLIMMRDVTTCCFGNVPNMNEYVIVTMKGEGIKPLQDVPVVLTGTFKISEIYEGGYLTSIFQMDGEKYLGPKK